MKLKSIELLNELNGQIEFLESELHDEMIRTQEILHVILKTLDSLKKIVIKHNFKSKSEEIYFFKKIKPQFTSKYLFYISILKMNSNKPVGGNSILENYYQSELDRIKMFFDDNVDFYKYHRTNSSYLDELYFLRVNNDFRLNFEDNFFERDPKFSTSHDIKVAHIIANDLLFIYLDKKINELDKMKLMGSQRNHNAKMTWTGSKVALTELIYALQTEGVINNGNASLKDIAEFFEEIFNIDLGQYRRNFLEIKTRKEEKTKFLNSLTNSLNKRISETDDFF